MTDQEKFEELLAQYELPIKERSICKHEKKEYCFYKSECTCCDWKDITWYKHAGCEGCVGGYMDSLFCGGHFENFRLFEEGKLESKGNDEIFTSEDRYKNVLNEILEDMNEEELIKVCDFARELHGMN